LRKIPRLNNGILLNRFKLTDFKEGCVLSRPSRLDYVKESGFANVSTSIIIYIFSVNERVE